MLAFCFFSFELFHFEQARFEQARFEHFRRAALRVGVCLALAAIFPWPAIAQDAAFQQPAERFQQFFDNFASNAGPMAPMFGKLSPEQLEKLEQVKITFADENQFGQRILDAFLQQLKQYKVAVAQQGKDVTYLRQLLKTLKPRMRHADRYKQLDVRVIDSESTDAFSIPGGRLLVTRGLLESATSEAAVVGVLAHELSHLDREHQLIPLKQSKLANQPLDFQDRMMWIALMVRPNRPEQESEADGDATRWMMESGYDPRELAKLLNSWDQQQNQVAPWLQFVPGFVKSHPDAGKRVQDVLGVAAKLDGNFPQAKYVGVENLRSRTSRSVRAFPQ
ncbi:MAG: M48 family metallopeptidase [Pirellulaceae bacterium]|nr:M48 family metallopeptidase [Pirellulaceae bacterium]